MSKQNTATLVSLVAVVVSALTLMSITIVEIQRSPLERTLQQYNHIRIYEDGSYIGETVDGVGEVGCIKGGLCND